MADEERRLSLRDWALAVFGFVVRGRTMSMMHILCAPRA